MDCDFDCREFDRYRIDLPYPKVTVTEENKPYARLISGAYAGPGSESTAIAQYTFHNHFTEEYPDVFTALKYITVVETTHLRLLGDLIKRLGLIPIYATYETNTYWKGSYPDYNTEIGKLIAADMQGERDAIAHYNRLIRQIRDEGMRELFRRIIMDEERHIEVLRPLYQKYR